jgi:hypothetical protein
VSGDACGQAQPEILLTLRVTVLTATKRPLTSENRYSDGVSCGCFSDLRRRRTLGATVLVFAVFVLVGDVNPLTWTGFRGQTLWNWLTLIILPVSILTVRMWPQSGRDLHRGHLAAATVLCTALVTTIIGGYWAGWSWTGYEGNTLWDRLTLVLAPAAVTTVLVPALVRLLTGAADERAERDRERAARELALRAARERLAHR